MEIYGDGANMDEILELNEYPIVTGFTTNPSLIAKAGVKNYELFAKDLVRQIPDKPISFEVITDDFNEMYTQAMKIASWGNNVYVKIPCTNTNGASSASIIRQLAKQKVKINVTAVLTLSQVCIASRALDNFTDSIISIFAGRIADTLIDPTTIITNSAGAISPYINQKMLWASTREIANILQASRCGCHIITMPKKMIDKYLLLRDKSLEDYSRETVKMFYDDAIKSGYIL